MLCWLRWYVSQKVNFKLHLIVSFTQVCYLGREYHRMQIICSSTRFCRTPLMATATDAARPHCRNP